MATSEREIVQECFDGDRERDCDYCPAHYTKNGICCFGHRYEDDDRQCMECPHQFDCSRETMKHEQRETRPRRIQINKNRNRPAIGNRLLPIVGQSAHREGSLLSKQAQQPKIQIKKREPEVLQEIEEQEQPGFWQQMGTHAVWGAGEGMLEMLLNFLRNRRPD